MQLMLGELHMPIFLLEHAVLVKRQWREFLLVNLIVPKI
jgi:hypothetical protein